MAEPLPRDRIMPLPRPRTRLLGRQVECASARKALLDDGVPLLSLLGPGGVGKTRLALAVAGEVEDAFADGIVWVDLAPLTDPDHVAGALATALDLTLAPNQAVLEALVRHLRARQTLLLLDNCEHVVAAVAELVAGLLTTCPALQVLATSRAPLRVRGEHAFPVEPLPLPPATAATPDSLGQYEAIQLFVERARAVRPAFALTAANASSVAALCRVLDGLPLATELAAARIKILSPEQLLVQMTDRLRLLHSGARDLAARQQTIENTIAWSYDLLDPQARELFRRLAVFIGGCELEAIVAVAGGDAQHALQGLEALCGQSLLRAVEQADGERRYTMLETVRAFALDRLEESGDAATVRDAHAAYFVALAEEADVHMRGPGRETWMGRLAADYPNLRAALKWLRDRGNSELALRLSGALYLHWQWQGNFGEGKQRLEEALALPETTRTAAWAKAQTALGFMTMNCFDYARARAQLEEALTVWRDLGDQRGIADALVELSGVELVDGTLDGARALVEEALATYLALDDDYGSMNAYWVLGNFSIRGGDYQRARAELEESLRLDSALGTNARGISLRSLGWLALAEGDERRAAALWVEALAYYRKHAIETALTTDLDDLGWLALRQGDRKRAASCFMEELTLGSEIGSDYDSARGSLGLAMVSVESGQAARAAWLFGAAETAASGINVIDDDMLHPIREPYERAVSATRKALGAAAFTAAWQAGRELPRQQAIVRALADAATGPAPEGAAVEGATIFDRLTRREMEVLRLLTKRLTDKEIAETLFISLRTANHHVARVYEKLEVNNRRDAGAVAVRLGLV